MDTFNPQAEASKLAARYREMSEKELAKLGSRYQSLTSTAQFALRTEFDRRGIPAPLLADDYTPDFEELVTVRYYRDLPEAIVAKSALESAGIYSFLCDENIARLEWGYAQVVGGIRLQVRPEDREAADEVLSQPVPPVIEAEGVYYEQPRCPVCGSLEVNIFLLDPVRRCAQCGAKLEFMSAESD
jgi:hypothetical protein